MPVSYRGISIEIGAETTELQKALGEIREKTKNTYAGLRDVNKLLKFDDTNVVGLTQKQQYLSEAIEATKDRQELYRKGMESLKQVEQEHGSLTDQQKAQYEQLERSYERCGSQIKNYSEDLERTNAALQTSTEHATQLSEQMSTLGDRMQSVGSKLSGIGDKLTIGLTVPLMAGAKQSVDAAVEIDSAFHDLAKTVDGTDEELQGFKEAAIELSKTQPVSASEIMQIEAMGGQLGIANENLQSFAGTVSGLSIASDLDAEEAAMQLAQFANVTGMAQEDADRYGSTIVDLGNHYAATESQITAMSDRVAAAGTQVGLTEPEILGLSTALTAMGINAEAGGTAISSVMSQIDKDVATGSENVQTWADAAQMSAQEFAATWQSDPVKALQAVFTGLDAATQEGSNMSVMLDDLGIKSIRQTDMMKRLSSNSQLLTQAIADANTAWQENSALSEEVDKRNESLASQMDILRNRATAVAAEMGEPIAGALLGIMDAAEPLIQLVESGAQAFADLSTGQQQLIVTALALTAAFGPVTSVTGRVIEGLGGVMSAASNGISAIEGFAGSLSEGKDVMDLTAISAEGLQGALAGLEMLGIAYVIMEVVGNLEELREHMETVRDATDGLVASTEAMGAAYDSASGESAVTSLREMADAATECLEAQAQLAETSRETWAEVGNDAALVDSYVETIEELTAKSELSKEEQAELAQAVQGFADTTGSAISIIDAQTGALNLQNSAIRDTAEAYKERAQAQAAEELYAENQKQMLRNEQEIADLERQITQTQKEHSLVLGQTGWEISNLIGDELDAYREMVARKDELVTANSFLERSEAELLGMMSNSGQVFATVEQALAASGITEAAYANLTEEQMARVRAAFDGTVASAVAALNQVNSAMGAMSSVTNTPKSISVPTPTYSGGGGGGGGGGVDNSALKEQQRAFDAEYKALQKELDREYKEQQKALDREYKERQKAYDKEYDALRKKLDSEYDAQADAYSKEEDALKKRLDAAYETRKKQLDKVYQQRKKSLDEQYAQAKKGYDQQYNELKKSLDREYKELQKQNDKVIKEQKKANSQEVSAFKAATKERIAAIKAEYDERKRIVAENDGTSEIDARIKSLEDETKAEQAEIKARERAEKVSELQRAVEQAKTRRTRQDAETALSEYLAQLAQEDREAQREAEIARLEEQKSLIKEQTEAKQEALNEERDNLIASYELQREDELESLQARQEMELEQLQLSLDAQEELLKANHDAQLESLKERQQEQLDALKESQQAELDALKDAQSTQLEALKDANSQRLQALKDAHSTQLQALKDHNQERLQTLKDQQSQELESLKESQQEQLESLKESQQEQLQAMKDAQQDALDSMRGAMGDAGSALASGLGDMTSTLEDELDQQNQAIDSAMIAGANAIDGALSSSQRVVADILRGMSNDVDDSMSDVEDSMDRGGTMGGQAFASGIDAAWNDVNTAAQSLSSTVTDELDSVQDWTYNSGHNAGANFASGLDDAYDSVMGAALSIANAVADYLHFSVPEKGPLADEDKWGGDMVDNLINGMISRERKLEKQTERMASIVEDGFDPQLAIGEIEGAELARMKSSLAAVSAARGQQAGIQLYVTFDKPVIRDERDISEITRKMTSALARADRSKLGR